MRTGNGAGLVGEGSAGRAHLCGGAVQVGLAVAGRIANLRSPAFAMHVMSFLSLAGAGAALFLALRLWLVPSENRAAAVALGVFLVCAAMFVADNVCYNEQAFAAVPWFYAVANPFILAIGPAFYLYGRAATEPAFTWRGCRVLHFIPSALWVLSDIPIYLMSIEEKVRQAAIDHTETPWWVMVALSVYQLGYVGRAWWRLWRCRARMAEEREEGRSHPVRGLLTLASLLLGVLLLDGIAELAGWALAANTLMAFAAVIGVFALLWIFTQPRPLALPTLPPPPAPESAVSDSPVAAPAEAPVVPMPAPVEVSPTLAPAEPPSELGSDRPRLPDSEVARIAARVRSLLEKERVYLDPTLSLQKLAEQAKTTRHNLSYVLKEALGATFYQLVASYRVRAAATALRAAGAGERTIADIAFACGFNTLSAFNAAFRAQFGVTPSAFRAAEAEKNVRKAKSA
jgi:AraC-like DNA-binding protein